MTEPSQIAKVSQEPAPYGRWPDGTPITQLEASAKQMDDWANRHGFYGFVRMGTGTQHDEPKRWNEVEVNRGKALPQAPDVQSIPPFTGSLVNVGLKTQKQAQPPVKKFWLRRFIDWLKGDR